MKTYHVVTPPEVQRVIRELVLYIARDSINNALAWEDRLSEAIQRIGGLPHGYPVDEGATERFGQPVRKVVFERTYLILYTVDDSRRTVVILNVRHGARLPRGREP